MKQILFTKVQFDFLSFGRVTDRILLYCTSSEPSRQRFSMLKQVLGSSLLVDEMVNLKLFRNAVGFEKYRDIRPVRMIRTSMAIRIHAMWDSLESRILHYRWAELTVTLCTMISICGLMRNCMKNLVSFCKSMNVNRERRKMSRAWYDEKGPLQYWLHAAVFFMSNDLKSIICAPAPYRVLHRRRFRQSQAHRY